MVKIVVGLPSLTQPQPLLYLGLGLGGVVFFLKGLGGVVVASCSMSYICINDL
jgi:hypothetical protein